MQAAVVKADYGPEQLDSDLYVQGDFCPPLAYQHHCAWDKQGHCLLSDYLMVQSHFF